MKPLFAFLLYLLVASLNTNAQSANNVWTFGTGGGLDYSSGSPVASTNNMDSEAGCASVSSYSGSLLFYSNGQKVWNRNHNVMPNGTGLQGNQPSSTAGQGVLIVPFINDTTKYYLFSQDTALYYSVVDMALNGGLGDIVAGQKNIKLAGGLGSELVAAPGSNCCVWVLTHKVGTKDFLAFKITETGVNTTPVTSNAGTFYGNGAFETGMLKASPSGKKLALTNFSIYANTPPNPDFDLPSYIDLFNFNTLTGVVNNAVLVDSFNVFFENALGVCFSPDGTKLYTTNPFLPLIPPGGSGIYQYDISSGSTATIMASKVGVGSSSLCSDLQIGPDNKIYVTPGWGVPATSIDCITDPDLAGTASNYIAASVPLSAGSSAKGMLPAMVVYPIKDTVFRSYTKTVCKGEGFQMQAPPGYLRYYFQGDRVQQLTYNAPEPGTYWVAYEDDCVHKVDTYHVTSFELSSGLIDTSVCTNNFEIVYDASTLNPPATQYLWNDGTTGSVYTATATGTLWVKMNLDGCSNTDTIRITSRAIPVFSIGRDTVICYGEQLVLEAPAHADSYEWQDGSAGRTFKVAEAGTYSVTITREDCVSEDKINVGMEDCACIPFVPNAFSPNGDGLNDVFNPFFKCAGLDVQFRINIFNRFGQRVFYGHKMEETWDGTFNGKPVDVGTYFYHIVYSNRLTTAEQKGEVIVVR